VAFPLKDLKDFRQAFDQERRMACSIYRHSAVIHAYSVLSAEDVVTIQFNQVKPIMREG